MSIKAHYTVLAELAREGLNGKVDLLGVFDRVTTKTVPVRHPHSVLAMLLVCDATDDIGKHGFRLTLKAPDGAVVSEFSGEVILSPVESGWAGAGRLLVTFQNLPLPQMGLYAFELTIGSEVISRQPLTVVQAETVA